MNREMRKEREREKENNETFKVCDFFKVIVKI